jgi:hypothetical protein
MKEKLGKLNKAMKKESSRKSSNKRKRGDSIDRNPYSGVKTEIPLS